MGLDITAYQKITPAPDVDYETADGPYFRAWENRDFPGRAAPVTDGTYKYEHSFVFRAGSYSGYNHWRRQLAELAGYSCDDAWIDLVKSGPFLELVNFSDCEGLIGSDAAARLAKDFADHQEKADSHPDEWFQQAYADWRKAFEMAADGGAVAFH